MTPTAKFTLVINTAEGLLQIALLHEEPCGAVTVPFYGNWHAQSQGAELLTPAIRDAFERLKIHPQDVARIAVVRGPGSFTGLRLAIASAAGLARATGALCAGIDYLPLLASSAWLNARFLNETSAHFWVVTHARRQLVHMQGFSLTSPADTKDAPRILFPGKPPSVFPLPPCCKERSPILVLTPEQAAEYIVSQEQDSSTPCRILGSGLDANRAFFTDWVQEQQQSFGPRPLLLPPACSHPGAEGLAQAALLAHYAQKDIEPLYVRAADAEENLERIAAALHMDPETARRRYTELTTSTVFRE